MEELSLNNNPLSYENFCNILDLLPINKSLKYLGLSELGLNGPAPIKENHCGFLTVQEAIIFKLANVLRYSQLVSIALDIDVDADLALEELECTLVKYNCYLKQIISNTINWLKLKPGSPLVRILRALKANSRMYKDRVTPKYLQDIRYREFAHLMDQISSKNTEKSHMIAFSENCSYCEGNSMERLPDTPQFSLSQGKNVIKDKFDQDKNLLFEKKTYLKINDPVLERLENTESIEFDNLQVKSLEVGDITHVEYLEKDLEQLADKELEMIDFKEFTEKELDISDINEVEAIKTPNEIDESKFLKITDFLGHFDKIMQSFDKYDKKFDDLSTKVNRIEKALNSMQNEFMTNKSENIQNISKLSDQISMIKKLKTPVKQPLNISQLDEEILKLESEINLEPFTFKDQEKINKDVFFRLDKLENNEQKFKNVKDLALRLQKELKEKIATIDHTFKISDEYNRTQESVLYSINEIERRMKIFDDKVNREIGSFKENLTQLNESSLIRTQEKYYQKSRTNELYRSNTRPSSPILKNAQNSSLKNTKLNFTRHARLSPERKDESFDERLNRLEKSLLKTPSSEKAIQSPDKTMVTDLSDVFPSEAESIMINAMLSKIDHKRKYTSVIPKKKFY